MKEEPWPSLVEIEAAIRQHQNTDDIADMDALRDFLLYDSLPRLMVIINEQKATIARQRKLLRKRKKDSRGTKVNASRDLLKQINERKEHEV